MGLHREKLRHVCNNKKYRHQYPRISITPIRGVMEGFLEEVVSKGVGSSIKGK